MKIQMPKQGVSYLELRRQNPPKRTERKALNIKPRDSNGDPLNDTEDQALPALKVIPPAPEADREDSASPDQFSQPEDTSTAQSQDSKEATAAPDTIETQTETEESAPKNAATTSKINSASDGQATKKKAPAKSRAAPDRVPMRGDIPVPARGAFPLFDATVEHYGEQAAIKVLLDAALKAVGSRLIDDGTTSYPNTGKRIRVHKTIPASDYEDYRKAVDPVGILAPFKIGSLYCHRLLVRFHNTSKNRNTA